MPIGPTKGLPSMAVARAAMRGGIVDAHGDGGDRQAVQQVEGVREALVLEVDHEVDLALAVELDLLRAVAMGPAKAEAVQHPAELAGVVAVVDELDELEAIDGRQRRRRRRAPDLLLEPQEGAHAVDRDPAGRCGAEVVAEDLVTDRSLVADLVELAHHRHDRQIALPRKAAIVPAQKEQIHLDRGRVGGLHEDDSIGRDAPDRVDRQPLGQDVEAVQDEADMLMVGARDGLPGLSIVVDVTAPGERLEADHHPEIAGELSQLVQVGGDPRHVVDRFGRDAAADQEERRAEPAPSARACASRDRRPCRATAPAVLRSRGRAAGR